MRKTILFLISVGFISCQSKTDEKNIVVISKPVNEIKIDKNNDSLIYKINENTVVVDRDTLALESPFIYSFEGTLNEGKKIQLHLWNYLSTEYGGYSKTASFYIEGGDEILYCYFEKDKTQDYYVATVNDYNNDNKIICTLKLYKLSTEEMYIEYASDEKSYRINPSKTFPTYKCYDEIDYTLFDSRAAFKKEVAMKEFTPSRDYNFFAEIISNDLAFDFLQTKLKYLSSDSLNFNNYKKWKHNFRMQKSKNEDENYSSETLSVVLPIFIDSNVYVVSDFSYSYMGGAHGMMSTTYDNYNIRTGRKINVEDIISISDKKFINFYKNKVKSEYQDDLLSDEVPITHNFYMLPTGIIFSYAPYELLGFAAGEPHVFCSYEELNPFILKNTILDYYNSN